jgi:hypothetical protein
MEDRVETRPVLEETRQNIDIHQRLNLIFEKFVPQQEITGLTDILLAYFKEAGNTDHEIELSKFPHTEVLPNGKIMDSDDLDSTVYGLWDNSWYFTFAPKDRESTQYGVLPKVVLGSDGKVYEFANEYYFDQNGHAGNSTYRHNMSDMFTTLSGEQILREKLNATDADIARVKQLDFIPTERSFNKNDAALPLNDFDYERINAILDAIENGDIVFDRVQT